MKKKIVLTETQLIDMIERIVEQTQSQSKKPVVKETKTEAPVKKVVKETSTPKIIKKK